MDSQDKMVVAVVAVGLIFLSYVLHLAHLKDEADMKFKYEAALNGAPVSVCVK